jgi:hypothetical protein
MADSPHSAPSRFGPSDPPDWVTVYYGIHDALRELGDPLNDAGDGPGLDQAHVIAGLWDASSALSRLFEQLEAMRGVLIDLQRVASERQKPDVNDSGWISATWVEERIRTALSFPAKHPYPQGYPDHLTADAHDWEPSPEQDPAFSPQDSSEVPTGDAVAHTVGKASSPTGETSGDTSPAKSPSDD